MESQLSHASSNDLLDSEELDEDEERQFFSLKKWPPESLYRLQAGAPEGARHDNCWKISQKIEKYFEIYFLFYIGELYVIKR